jgi:ComEC/Rec2-related protein
MWNGFLSKVQNYIKSGDETNPSLFVLLGLIIPIIAFISFDSDLIRVFSTILLSIGISLIIFTKKVFLKFVLWLMIGVFIFCFSSGFFSGSSVECDLLQGKREIKATVIDYKAVGKHFNWLHNPNYLEIKINGYRIEENDKWTNCSVNTIAKIKNNSNIKYGDSLILSGYVTLSDDPIVEGSFNYKNYLKSLGINHIFYGIVEEKTSDYSFLRNIFSGVYKLRNNFLNSLCSGIGNDKVKTFLAGIMFGCRQNISQNTKDIFINNGTIHILAISGLHVGILAVFLLLIFRFLPVQIRFSIIPFLLFFYVFLSGLQPSAVRAFVMISIFCIFRAFFLSDKAFNNILFAAVVLILSNPFVIVSGGFQFSFIITGILVLSWRKCTEWKDSLFEKHKWILIKKRNRFQIIKFKIYQKLFTALFACLLAAAASAGLTLFYQSLIIPLMPILNFIIVPLMFPLFLVSIIKITIVFLFGNFLNILLNGVLCFFTKAIFQISVLGSSVNTVIHTEYISIFLIIVFYIFALAFIFYKNKAIKQISLLICCSIFLSGLYKNMGKDNLEMFLVKPAGNIGISYIYVDSAVSKVNIVNLPGNSAYVIRELFKKHNFKSIDTIFLNNTTKKYCANTEYLIKNFGVERLVVSENIRASNYYRKLKTICIENNVNIFKSNKLKTTLYNIVFIPDKNSLQLHSNRTGDIYSLKSDSSNYGATEANLTKNGNSFKEFKLLNSNQTKVIKI